MKIVSVFFSIYIALHSLTAMAENSKEVKNYIEICKKDLNFFRKIVKDNSAPFANKEDKDFPAWYKKGYKDALQLIDGIRDADDCYYVMKYYINGFNISHISLRGYVLLPPEQYPGILSAKNGDGHYIIYRHPALKYLGKVKVGDRLTHINGQKIDDYYKDYLLPFYANDRSELTLEAASLYALMVDGNRYKPSPRTITIMHGDEELNVDLKYTDLDAGGLQAARQVKQPDVNDSFKVEMVSNGIWIKIPSFFPGRSEIVYYTGMLSRLKNDLAKEDYILFDMRGNRGGGASRWARPVLRNLWGDDFIKSLGKNHSYNKHWIKKQRISRQNFLNFAKTRARADAKEYKSQLKKGADFFLKKWSIYDDKENLYTNTDSKRFNAKIYVLTDNFCRSTCWTFVKEMKQLGAVHIGEQTTVQSIYSYAKKERSPSEMFDFFYPTQIRIEPHHKLGEALVPSRIYEGDFRDEAKLIDWVLSVTEGKKI